MSSSTDSFDTTISCRPTNSRLGACVVINTLAKGDDDIWIEVTLSPEEVEQFVIQLKIAKADAVARYGRKDGEPPEEPVDLEEGMGILGPDD